MERRQGAVISFWKSLKRGPWSEHTARRIENVLQTLPVRLASLDGIVALIVYGSYARGEAGRQSDLDLLILFEKAEQVRRLEKETLSLISRAESEGRLPVHISPLLASLDDLEGLGDDLIHAIASDGVVIYGQLSALARFVPGQSTPAVIITFSLPGVSAAERMRLRRRLQGYAAWREKNGQRRRVTYAGLITPPARNLGPGVLLVPGERRSAVLQALDEAGAIYTETHVWLVG